MVYALNNLYILNFRAYSLSPSLFIDFFKFRPGLIGPVCSCSSTYHIQSDRKSCGLSDACYNASRLQCDHFCAFQETPPLLHRDDQASKEAGDHNSVHYRCACAPGYEISSRSDGSTGRCQVVDRQGSLLISTGDEIRALSLNNFLDPQLYSK